MDTPDTDGDGENYGWTHKTVMGVKGITSEHLASQLHSVAMIKHFDQKQLTGGRSLFHLTLPVHNLSLGELRVETTKKPWLLLTKTHGYLAFFYGP